MPNRTDICTDFNFLSRNLEGQNRMVRKRTRADQSKIPLNIDFYDVCFDHFIQRRLSAGVGRFEYHGNFSTMINHMKIGENDVVLKQRARAQAPLDEYQYYRWRCSAE